MRLGFGARLLLRFGLLWALFWGLGALGGYLALRHGLVRHLEEELLLDAARVAAFYRQGETGRVAATGGTEITLYDYQGRPVLPPDPLYRVPAEAVAGATSEPRLYRGPGFLAAYADAGVGVIAVAQGTGFIEEAAGAAARTLGAFLLLGLVLGGALVYLQARAASAPLEAAAREVERRGWENLEPIPYRGPDDELARIVHRFNALLAELRSARERERAFLDEVAHELFTPMSVLLAELERGELAAARESARHLLRLAEDLFALARGDLARTLEPHLLDLREVARAVAREFPGVATALPEKPVWTVGDPDRLRQLLRNLVANAVRAAGAGKVRIQVGEDGSGPWLRVEDRGPGIPAELLPRIFERYQKGPRGRQGLGLAIAQEIAKAHGGEIRVRSEPGNTVFEVRLPGLEEE